MKRKLSYTVTHKGCDADVYCEDCCMLGEIYLPVKDGQVPEKLEISDAENRYEYQLVKVFHQS